MESVAHAYLIHTNLKQRDHFIAEKINAGTDEPITMKGVGLEKRGVFHLFGQRTQVGEQTQM